MPPKRIEWLDIGKGVAIILMAYGHVMQGMAHRNLLNVEFYRASDAFVYSFHMYFFVFVAGCFLSDIHRRRYADIVKSRSGTLLWPYVLWGLIALALEPHLKPFKFPGDGSTFSYASGLFDLLTGTTSWFLYTLFACHVLLAIYFVSNIWFALVVALLLQAAVYAGLPPSIVQLQKIPNFFVFFMLGVLAGTRFIEMGETIRRWPSMTIALACSATILVQLALVLGLLPVTPSWSVMVVTDIAAINGIAMTTLASILLARSSAANLLQAAGIASIAIFLLSPYFQGAARLIVSRIAGDAPTISVIVQTLAAGLIPIAIYFAAQRFGMGWLFVLRSPARPKTALEPATSLPRDAGG